MAVYVQAANAQNIILSYNPSPLQIGDDGSFAVGFWSFASTGVGITPKLTFASLNVVEDFFSFSTGEESIAMSSSNGGSGIFYGGLLPISPNDTGFQFHTAPLASGWNSFLFVCEGTGIRHSYINGHKTTDVDMATKFDLLKDLYSNSSSDNRSIGEIAWWGSGITDIEARSFGSGISPIMIARDRLHSYWPLYNTNSMYDVLGNSSPFVIYTGSPSGANQHPPVRNLARAYYPQQSDSNSLNLFLRSGPVGCLPYDSGNGAFSSAFGTAFDKQLCGSPPGWHMTLFLDGRQISSGTNDLYIYGHDNESGIASMFLKVIDFVPDDSGAAMPDTAMNLYLRGPIAHESSGDIPLFMWSTTNPSIYKSALLYLEGAEGSGQYNNNINFIVKNELSESYTSSINTFLKAIGNSDGSITHVDNIPLIVYNNTELSSGTMSLFMNGPSGTDGAIPFSGSMNLFMNRQNESLSHNIQIYIPTPTQTTEDLNMYLDGQPRPTGIIPMYMFAGNSGIDDLVKLYTHGF